jgi:hypothetical protein
MKRRLMILVAVGVALGWGFAGILRQPDLCDQIDHFLTGR